MTSPANPPEGERRKGHSKLVYNKTTRTIDTVDPHPPTLLPCPFCGKEPRSGWNGANGPDDDSGYWSIECCGAFAHEDDEQTAARLWNTRTPMPERDGMREALREARPFVVKAEEYGVLTRIDRALAPPDDSAEAKP